MFYSKVDRWYYSNPVSLIDGSQDLFCGFDIDTEYTQGITRKEKSITITGQIKGISDDEGKIYSHSDLLISRVRKGYEWDGKPKHPVFKDWIIVNYLNDMGYKVSLERSKDRILKKSELPKITIDIYGMFLVVDYLRVVTGVFRDDLKDYSTNHEGFGCSRGIKMERRLRTFTQYGQQYYDWVELPWILTINNFPYQVRLRFYDLTGLHGNVGYKDIAKNVGFSLPDKELIEQWEKEDMLKVYNEDVERFNKYSLGDLHCRELLIMNDKMFGQIYTDLNFNPEYETSKLTIGKTTANLIESYIYSSGVPKKLFEELCQYSNADHLKRLENDTAKYLMKVDGGRCFNNRPLITTAKCEPKTFRFMDIDMSGAYSQPQVRYPYPIGNPKTISLPIKSTGKNKYDSLRKFLKKYKKEFVPGLWFARVSLKEGYQLENRQDVFMSWYPGLIHKCDTDREGDDSIYSISEVGWSKIFTNEINLAVITHDLLEWLENVASEKQRKELLDNLEVEAAMFYPKSKQVTSIDELIEKLESFEGVNTCEIDENGRKVTTEDGFNYWYPLNYGDDFIKKIQSERKKHDKGTPLNTLYKLIGNTSYGDMVSKYFNNGNVCLGNNITAMTRVTMWCIEKTFNGYQSITDGCIINLDEQPVMVREGRKLNGVNTVTGYRYNTAQKDWTATKVFFDEILFHSDCETIEQWLKQKVLTTFPNLSCLSYYDIEIKRIGDEITLHGSANYAMKGVIEKSKVEKRKEKIDDYYIGKNNIHDTGYCEIITSDINLKNIIYDENVYKMRSYNKEGSDIDWDSFEKDEYCEDEVYDTEDFILEEKTNIAEKFLNNLALNPKRVKRSKPFLMRKIIKPGEYVKRIKSYEDMNLEIGETEFFERLPLEISINQFAYKSKKQYLAFKKESEDLKIEYGQGFEMFFPNDDETLDYQRAIEMIDRAIEDGAMNLQRWLKKIPRNAVNPSKDIHPYKYLKQGLKNELETDYFNE